MRYQARWSNGCWKVFDRMTFADVAMRALQVDAVEAAIEFNIYQAKSRRVPGKRW